MTLITSHGVRAALQAHVLTVQLSGAPKVNEDGHGQGGAVIQGGQHNVAGGHVLGYHMSINQWSQGAAPAPQWVGFTILPLSAYAVTRTQKKSSIRKDQRG